MRQWMTWAGWLLAGLLLTAATSGGCAFTRPKPAFESAVPLATVSLDVEGPTAVEREPLVEPLSIHEGQRQTWLLTPEEAIQIALANSPVMRDLSATIVQSPANVRTIHGPALQESDPRFGVEAALSAFDATFSSNARFEKNDYVINNQLLGGGTNVIRQDLIVHQTQISKTAATGTELYVRHNTDYDHNNAPGNLFRSVWNTNYEAEIRHPLLRGSGLAFNRLAGPDGSPGVYNGVVIARVNADISLADFEIGLRDLVNSVENAYWDLYLAYRDLEAKIAARDAALSTWRQVQARDKESGDPEREAQAREQYFRFKEDVQNALAGRLVEGTRSHNGSSGGTLTGTSGVLVAERRLRLLLGVPINDAFMIRPAHDPVLARVVFDWSEIADESLDRRIELRRQALVVKRREMEWTASRNLLLPQFDAYGRYRWRGFGHDLIHSDRAGRARFDNAYMDLTTGDFQEWQLGFEFSVPLGQRQAHAAVHNAQLQLAREKAVLHEQQRQIQHDLSNAVADMERAFEICQTAQQRRVAAHKRLSQLEVLRENERTGKKVELNTMLDAQNRAADADVRFYRALVEYVLAVKNVHYEKGSLLEYDNIFLADRVPLCRGELRISRELVPSAPAPAFATEPTLAPPSTGDRSEAEVVPPPASPVPDPPADTAPKRNPPLRPSPPPPAPIDIGTPPKIPVGRLPPVK